MEVELSRAEVVFVGRVTQMAIETRSEGNYRYEVMVCNFVLAESLKGISSGKKTLSVFTRMADTACGYPFELGQSYLVYANEQNGALETNSCRRTKPLTQPKQEIAPINRFNSDAKIEIDNSGKQEAAQIRALLLKKK